MSQEPDYLFDPKAPADREIQRLENTLAPYRKREALVSSRSDAAVLRVAVTADGVLYQEVHQEHPGPIDVGTRDLGESAVTLIDARTRSRDHRRLAPMWLGLGLLVFFGGVGLFGFEVSRHTDTAAADTQDISTYLAYQETEGTGGLGLGLALLGLFPLMLGVVDLTEPKRFDPEVDATASKHEPEPASAMPSRLRLFDYVSGDYYLVIPAEARGKVSLNDRKTATIEQLRRRFGANGILRVKLGGQARGKLVIGPTTILFQMAAPALPAPKMALPANLVDWLGHFRLSRVEGFSLAAAMALFVPLFVMLALIQGTEPDASDRFRIAMGVPVEYEEPEPEEEAEDETLLAQEDEDEKEEEKVVEEEDEVATKELAEKPTKYSEAALEKARGVGINRVLGTYGGPGEGTVLDVIQGTENNLGDLFAQGMTSTVDADGTGVSEFVAGGEGISASGAMIANKGLGTGEGPAQVGKQTKKEKKIKGRLKSTTDEVFGDVDKGRVKATIRRRMSALQACYEKALRARPDLQGKMSFTIEISTVGKVTSVSIEQDSVGDASVKTCAKAKIKGWRFPTEGAEDSAEVSFSVVFESG